MTADELTERLHYWQRVLRLQDWLIVAKFVSGHVFDTPNQRGDCEWESTHEYVLIQIAEAGTHRAQVWEQPEADDPEYTLVHELLHVVLRAWDSDRDTPEHRACETAINKLARALVRLERRPLPATMTDYDG